MAPSNLTKGQYRLHAYVCGNACLRTVESMGTMSFPMIFIKRPDNCRYAVVSRWDVVTHNDQVLVWDLYDAREKVKTGEVVEPDPIWVGDSVDAAIMATFMTYDRGE